MKQPLALLMSVMIPICFLCHGVKVLERKIDCCQSEQQKLLYGQIPVLVCTFRV